MSTLAQRAVAKPSSTITWAFLAGVLAALCWEAVGTFTSFNPSPGLISGSTTFFAGLVGKLVPEKVLTAPTSRLPG